jgi:nitrilase
MTIVKGAVIQAGTVLFDKAQTMERFADLLGDAAKQKAQLAVFPEAFIGGYVKGIDFGVRMGMRSDEGREDFARYFDNAIEVPGEDTNTIAKLVKDAGLYAVIGVIERAGGTLYCTTLYFAPDGSLLGKHRKIMPTAMERVTWGFGDGSTLIAPETEIGVIGGAICWENLMPQMRLAMYAKGVEFYCAPTVDDRENWHAVMRTTAWEGRCFVLSAVQFLTINDYPDGYDIRRPAGDNAPLINGGSCIISPMGEVLAGPIYGEEAVLTADMDKSVIAKGKYDFDVVGHYARPDIFTLHIDEREKKPVRSDSDDQTLAKQGNIVER